MRRPACSDSAGNFAAINIGRGAGAGYSASNPTKMDQTIAFTGEVLVTAGS